MRCDECKFWSAIDGTNGVGECHRYAPKPTMGYYQSNGSEKEMAAYWPETLMGEWCGEFQRKDELHTEE